MFWNKKPSESPLKAQFAELASVLTMAGVTVDQKPSGALTVHHEHFVTEIDTIEPLQKNTPNGPIKAVVQIRTVLPQAIQSLFPKHEMTLAGNKMAALSALVSEGKQVIIGSRLTIYESEDAWKSLHFPLLMFSALQGPHAILSGLRKMFANEPFSENPSAWTEQDLSFIHSTLSRICVATDGGLGVTAEIPLSANAMSAISGDGDTALLEIKADQPHPELGGGLFILLQMPNRTKDEAKLKAACLRLNQMEFEARDLPPFFGAWCEGKLGGNPAYISFIPNEMHSVQGIGLNFAIWALIRAKWANDVLRSMGILA